MGRPFFFNYFKHIPEDLVISSTPGVIISAIGTVLLITLFMFELRAYLTISTTTELIVDELVDEVLRVNFNVTLHEAPCEFLSVDVSDLTGTNTHNITKDILKWRLDSSQRVIDSEGTAVAHEAKQVKENMLATYKKGPTNEDDDEEDEDEEEPLDASLSQSLTPETFVPFMKQHELTVVNFFAPWCIWCRRLEPVYLEAASKVPTLHFHGHARLSQVDCVAHQDFCGKQMIRAYPTLRMYKDGDPVSFELFTGQRTVPDLLAFVQQQMTAYKKSHTVLRKQHIARFDVVRGALTGGTELYRAKMEVASAQTFCGSNPACVGFTWAEPAVDASKTNEEKPAHEQPMIFFKGGEKPQDSVNNDQKWTSHIKIKNATEPISAAGSLTHGPAGCQIAGHLQVRKVPGSLKFVLHSPDHDHEASLINASHIVNEFWFGDPLSQRDRKKLAPSDVAELDSPTSHLIERLPFTAAQPGHAHVHYLKVVTKLLKHVGALSDTVAYKYTVHSNKYEAEEKVPSVEFKYDLSPISIVVHQVRTPAYRFLTSTCAIIGGVFTVIGLLESILHHTASKVLKKQI